MTPQQISLVQASFVHLAPISTTVAAVFYDRLFTLDPASRQLFTGDMEAQGRKLMQTIGIVVMSLDHVATVLPALQDLGRLHAAVGVQPSQYATVGEALLWALEKLSDSHWTPEVQDAWAAAYTAVADAMLAAAKTVG